MEEIISRAHRLLPTAAAAAHSDSDSDSASATPQQQQQTPTSASKAYKANSAARLKALIPKHGKVGALRIGNQTTVHSRYYDDGYNIDSTAYYDTFLLSLPMQSSTVHSRYNDM